MKLNISNIMECEKSVGMVYSIPVILSPKQTYISILTKNRHSVPPEIHSTTPKRTQPKSIIYVFAYKISFKKGNYSNILKVKTPKLYTLLSPHIHMT